MSYWVTLQVHAGDDDSVVEVDRHSEGGTYQVGGTDEASLNVTYNYGEVYALLQRLNPDCPYFVRDLDGRRASDVLPLLDWACEVLPDRPYMQDYWAPTPGNAGHVLHILRTWARQHPDAVFRVR